MTRILCWTVLFALVIEILINHFLTGDYSIRKGSIVSQLTNFFEYGRSTEGKVFEMIAENDAQARISAKLGWFRTAAPDPAPPNRPGTWQKVDVYGMSFSNHIGELLTEIDESLKVNFFDGPGAPLNHSYAYYLRNRPHQRGDIVILGILASSLPALNTMTHMTRNFEAPSPHFYPRYRIGNDGGITEIHAGINSLQELRTVINDKSRWENIKRLLADNDTFYDAFIFEKNILDRSAYARLIKRAWGQRSIRTKLGRFHTGDEFINRENTIEVARALVVSFVDQVRSDHAIPYLILFNDRLYDDHLFRILEPVLIRNKIDYYSTHREYPATNLANFIADGHFKPEIDRAIAAAVYKDLMAIRDRSLEN